MPTPLINQKAVLAACREYRRKAAFERALHRKLHDTLDSDNDTKRQWEAAKAARNAQLERIALLIETGRLK